jgi:hypothetical protein
MLTDNFNLHHWAYIHDIRPVKNSLEIGVKGTGRMWKVVSFYVLSRFCIIQN